MKRRWGARPNFSGVVARVAASPKGVGGAFEMAAPLHWLQIPRVEGQGQQLREPQGLRPPAQVHDVQPYVAAELPQHLPAGPAGRGEPRRVGHHGHGVELRQPLGEGLEDGHALGAHGEPVRRALDVAAGDDLARARAQGRADLEAREGCYGTPPRLPRPLGQVAQSRRAAAAGAGVRGRPHASRAASPMTRPSTSSRPAFTFSATSSTSRWSSFFLSTPAAMLVMQDRPSTRMPMCRAAMTSGTVDMPTASAPMARAILISAGVSYDGPLKAM